jgi:hypothetical protein
MDLHLRTGLLAGVSTSETALETALETARQEQITWGGDANRRLLDFCSALWGRW